VFFTPIENDIFGLYVYHFDTRFQLTPFFPNCCTDIDIAFSASFGSAYDVYGYEKGTWGLDNVVVSSTPIPEPATAGLVALGLFASAVAAGRSASVRERRRLDARRATRAETRCGQRDPDEPCAREATRGNPIPYARDESRCATTSVAHCGDSMAGSFSHTLVLTDIASGWTECIALLVRESTLVVDGIECLRRPCLCAARHRHGQWQRVRQRNAARLRTQHSIEFTRSRPHRKNDQAWVEQKNGFVVRRLAGYGRLEGIRAVEALARLYSASRLFVNFFQPSFKLAEKTRVGARVSKRYHAPETPCARLLASPAISEPTKERLRAVLLTLDPLRLHGSENAAPPGRITAGVLHVLPHRDADLVGSV
jgi:hypothetical protein